jgi:hypothetical protein
MTRFLSHPRMFNGWKASDASSTLLDGKGELPMYLSAREFWGVVHGMVLGALFLLAYGGGLAGLYSLRPDWVTPAGVRERLMRLKLGAWGMTIAAWLTPILATAVLYVIYVYGEELAKDTRMRTVLMVFFTLAFVAAAAAGLFGAWSWISRVTKAWP